MKDSRRWPYRNIKQTALLDQFLLDKQTSTARLCRLLRDGPAGQWCEASAARRRFFVGPTARPAGDNPEPVQLKISRPMDGLLPHP